MRHCLARAAAAGMFMYLAPMAASSAASYFKTIYSFPAVSGGAVPDGSTPTAGLTGTASGELFGTTTRGGSYDVNGYGGGVAFRLSPPTSQNKNWTETVLHAFTGFNDGIFPSNGNVLVDKTGAVYGTTDGNGSFIECGHNENKSCDTIYKLSPPTKATGAWAYSLLHIFSHISSGYLPVGGVIIDKNGALIGAAKAGGNMNCQSSFSNQQGSKGCGLIYELTSPAKGKTEWTYSVIYRFTGKGDGGLPAATLLADPDGSGVLYGTASTGGNGNCTFGTANCGVVFKLTPPASKAGKWVHTTLHIFTGKGDGAAPYAALVMDKAGKLYGTTSAAGGGCQTITGCGTVFELSPPAGGKGAWRLKTLHAFAGGDDGAIPLAGVTLGAGGALYGTTTRQGDTNVECGSAIGCGTVFKLTPPSAGKVVWKETVLHPFATRADGGNSSAALWRNPKSGVLFGTAAQGGNLKCQGAAFMTGCGAVFSLTE